MDPAALLMFRKMCFAPANRPMTFCPHDGMYSFAKTLRQQHQVLLMTLFVQQPHEQKRELSTQAEEEFCEAFVDHLEHIVRVEIP